MTFYAGPDLKKSTFQPWEKESEDTIAVAQELATSPEFWERLATHFSSETLAGSVVQDNVSCVKSICKIPPAINPVQS